MNKKFLFAAMSLAALTACSTDDFESQNVAEQSVSPVKFEVINSGALTRASMNTTDHKIVWSANDGDLFTLYHGATVPTSAGPVSGFANATYTATAGANGGAATLTTPSMINAGAAVMVWPVDTIFRITAGNLSIKIPTEQTNIENNIPYMSDLVDITARTDGKGVYNYAGYNRSYPVFMRQMASQLIVKTDYNGTDATIKKLYEGETGVATGDGIAPIEVTSMGLQANTAQFTTEIDVKFTPVASYTNPRTGLTDVATSWATVAHNAWSCVAGFDLTTTPSGQSTTLTAKEDCLIEGNQGCTFLILPQQNIGSADNTSAVIVKTNYGKVVIGDNGPLASGSAYIDATEGADAWYRYVSSATTAAAGEYNSGVAETSGEFAGKYKVTAPVKAGLMQTLNGFSTWTAPNDPSTAIVYGEPIGTWAIRYVKVLLNHLDMTDLHITSDKQLRDAVRVWNKIGHASTTFKLDGDANGVFKMSQKTIALINEINAAAGPARKISVMPCTVSGEACSTIVITGGDAIAADLSFIKANSGTKADVVLNAGESWKWAASTTAVKKITVDASNNGISKIINKGTLTSNATATLAIYNNASTPAQIFTVPFENAKGAKWDITAGVVNVQFSVTNLGTVNIASGAQYRQDGNAESTNKPTFTNQALTLPKDYLADPTTEQIGVVNNEGVFATVSTGVINNYGLIEHANKDAMTFITNNATGAGFAAAFNDAATSGGTDNKMGRINLPWDNKEEEYISISNAAATLNPGFVSVTINGEVTNKKLNNAAVGALVNYVIVKNGINTIEAMPASIKYVEINEPSTRIEWKGSTTAYSYTGLMVLSELSIQRNTTVNVTGSTYLEADLYNGGAFSSASYTGYYGGTDTSATRIITW